MKEVLRNKNEKIELCIGILLGCIILFISVFFINYFYHCKKCNDSIEQMQDLTSSVFSFDKIILYSSASTTKTPSTLHFDISQFTDIAIFIDNHANNTYTSENTIKDLWINEASFSALPEQSHPTLYPKDLDSFGIMDDISNKEPIENGFVFPVVASKDHIDFSHYEVASTCSTPIVLEYINQDILKDYPVSTEDSTSLNGSILKKAGIPFSSMETHLSFCLHIVNGFDEHFVSRIYIPISLHNENNSNSIYTGSFVEEIDSLQNYTFWKEK